MDEDSRGRGRRPWGYGTPTACTRPPFVILKRTTTPESVTWGRRSLQDLLRRKIIDALATPPPPLPQRQARLPQVPGKALAGDAGQAVAFLAQEGDPE